MRTIKTIAALLLAIISIAPDAHARKRLVLDAASKPILFRLDVAGAITPPGETFSRASSATYRDAAGVLQTASSGVKRNAHYALDPVSGLYKRTLLLEGQRTNLVLRSEEFDNASWVKEQLTVTANPVAAPDGTSTGDKLVESAASGNHVIYQALIGTAAEYTFSVFLKAGERTFAQVYLITSGTDHGVSVNLSTGVIGTVTGTITGSRIEAYPNGWYRVSITKTLTAASWYPVIGLATADGAIRAIYLGDITKGIYAWGAQVELGAFPSSYIPTTTATVTRAADSLSFPYLHPPQEMTVFVRGIEGGTSLAAARYLQIGLEAEPRLLINTTPTNFYHGNGVGSANPTTLTAPALGNAVELLLNLSASGSVKGTQSINKAAETSTTTAAMSSGGLGSAWNGNALGINSTPAGTTTGHFGFRDIIVAKGIRDLAFFRGLIAP